MSRYGWYIVAGAVALSLAGCVSSPRFTAGRTASWNDANGEASPVAMAESGVASFYADEFNGRQTSNGETYDMNAFTAAHRTLPFNTQVRVTNLGNGKSTVVRINDRGPFKDDRIIDLSLAAAKAIELIGTGTASVRLEVVQLGDTTGIPQHYAR